MIGHRAGARAVNRTIDRCLELGIPALTLFAFSSENWGRPAEEVEALMKLFLHALEREVDELHRRGVRVRFVGQRERFGPALLARMQAAEQRTQGNALMTLSIAARYCANWKSRWHAIMPRPPCTTSRRWAWWR